MPPKRKSPDDHDDDDNSRDSDGMVLPLKKRKRKACASVQPWSREEEQALLRGMIKLALCNVAVRFKVLRQDIPGRDTAKINNKIRSMGKNLGRSLGDDGKWLDTFRVDGQKKEHGEHAGQTSGSQQ